MNNILSELAEVLEERKSSSPEDSYVASLYAEGLDKILDKVNEEAAEIIQAAKEHDHEIPSSKKAVIHETADLWFHTIVMLIHLGLGPEQVLDELKRRFKISGLEEKASRQI